MAEVKEMPVTKSQNPKEQESPAKAVENRAASTTPTLTANKGTAPVLLRHFAHEMDRLFENFGLRLPGFVGRGRELLRRETGLIPAEWSPCIDISENNGHLLVRVDLPGLSKDDIQVSHTDDTLVIRGERKQEQRDTRSGYAYSECEYGGFYRALPLPEGADASKSKAEYHDGVLEVSMPFSPHPERKVHRVEIQEKK